MESHALKELSFFIVLRENKWQNFQKNAEYPILGPFSIKFDEQWTFIKNWALSISNIYDDDDDDDDDDDVVELFLLYGWATKPF